MNAALKLVAGWHTALNTGRIEDLLKLVQPEVEIGGPRGKTHGATVVKEWFGRANVRLYPLRFFNRQNAVVVEEQGEWRSPGNGQVTDNQVVASVFVVKNGLIASILRYDSLELALQDGGLDWSDEIQPD